MNAFACHGDILYSPNAEKIESFADHWIVVESGIVSGIFPVLPQQYAGIEQRDYDDKLIIPAFSDLHIHASQYFQRSVGMDKLLFDWLNDYTFPQEARFSDASYARAAYSALIDDFIRHGTFHASLFATKHTDSTGILFDLLEEKGISALVGKVNMDRNSPAFLCETTEESLRETDRFLADHSENGKVRPIITPRFAPTCSEELLRGLGKLAQQYHCPMQTHLVESREQVAFTMGLFPEYGSDAEIYQRAGLMENLSILAHVIFPTAGDLKILKQTDSICVHCPDATANITAGIMPLVWLADMGVSIALGSDVGGGHAIPVYRQIARAIQLSKLKQFYEPEQQRVTLARAFYHATKAGGSVFGNVGAFEKGYRFDALVLERLSDAGYSLSPIERLERFCYIGDDRNIAERYLAGNKL